MMSKAKIPAAALLLVILTGAAPLTASAPISASAAAVSDSIKVQSMNVKMIFDGVNIQPPAGQHVFIYNNTTYVPIRFVSYALQKSVSWDAKNLKVTVAEPTSSELVIIKEYLMNAGNTNNAATANKSIVLNKVKASYVFNGSVKAVPAGQASYMLNGSMYVPLRFLSESVGNKITWDQKTKTITAASAGYQEENNNLTGSNTTGGNASNTTKPSATATPAPAGGAAAGGGGAGTGTVTYNQITSATEAKLTALRSESASALTSLAIQYVSATDSATKSSLLAKGQQQLSSFTASFNNIIADAEKQLTANGYSTEIINQYRATFEAELEAGKKIAESMGN
ncbi:hypothetical protein C2I18_05890 [Paenibacillus sp. PK3_47]|uniref:copper amine oxidase N-terminal domain-containing protein n=1 Tax=Paenibacillus sp. PK3_47 TaxID=2072642 RepID=UPI00201E1502|nr:copper amine oxidase N-terminal domain-containing protein [Paenibacillus sp. PK3_47]UQZ33129.1 hypothetical protein C2I18_05890 [Paenibacillus sp. PK3_47]